MAAIMLKPLRSSGSLSDEFVDDGHEGDTLGKSAPFHWLAKPASIGGSEPVD